MTTPTCSIKPQKNEEEDVTASSSNIMVVQETACFLCQRNSFFKRVLRVVIKECSFCVSLLLIRLHILDGMVIFRNKERVNFLRLTEEHRGLYPTRDDLARIRSSCKFFETVSDTCHGYPSRRASVEEEKIEDEKSGFVQSFIFRLAENLGIDVCTLEESIDHVMTGCNEILLDMDHCKLAKFSSRNEDEIDSAISQMFWQPKSPSRVVSSVPTSRPTLHFSSYFTSRIRSHSVPRDRSNDNGWFESVDHGRVVPFCSRMNASIFKSSNNVRHLLDRCIHKIEENMINAFSWYVDDYFYHDFNFPRVPLSYAEYEIYRKSNDINNAKVMVVKDNPLELGTNFAYVLALNWYSNHKYIQQYMQDSDLLCKSIIRIDKDVPFVIRSLNPTTLMHIFHMVYKRNHHSRPSYENVFKTLVMLRDAMLRLRLKDVSMCKIGCCCERLNFSKVLNITEYIFLGTDINVRIGLNLIKCWHFRSRSLKSNRRSSESADLRLERMDGFLAHDDISDDSDNE